MSERLQDRNLNPEKRMNEELWRDLLFPKGVLGNCICKDNEEDYMRPCPEHFPSESERDLAYACLQEAANPIHLLRVQQLLAKAAAVIDRQVSRQDWLQYELSKRKE